MKIFLPSEGYSLTDLVSLMLAVIGGTFGLWQYYRANREARARAAADELERFNADESVKTALRVVDWYCGSITVIDETGARNTRAFGRLDFHLSLRPHSRRRSEVRDYIANSDYFRIERERNGQPFEDYFSPTEQYVREVFDAFLGRLERIEMLIENGVIGEENFRDVFSYWLHVIGDRKDAIDELGQFSNEKREALIEYIKYYKFSGVLRLFARYGKPL